VFFPKTGSSKLNTITFELGKWPCPPAGCWGPRSQGAGPRVPLPKKLGETPPPPGFVRPRGPLAGKRWGPRGSGQRHRWAVGLFPVPGWEERGGPERGSVPGAPPARSRVRARPLGEGLGGDGGRGRRRERSCKSHDFPAYINHSLFFSTGCRLKGAVSSFYPKGRDTLGVFDAPELGWSGFTREHVRVLG
jgi:hypothetical protein